MIVTIATDCIPVRLMPEQWPLNIGRLRLHNQQISTHRFTRPAEVVAWLGAMQAQDYPGALWSIGLRLPGATQEDIEHAIAERTIVRTWPMRGTLHFVAAEDLHWMRTLLAPRIIARSAGRHRQLELTDAIFTRAEKIFLKALRGGQQLTREEMFALLEKSRISTTDQRGYHILWRLAQEGLLCFGTHRGKQPTFTLLDEWLPAGQPRDAEACLAELALRYFTSHGPATMDDFVAWSGLRISEAKAGVHLLSTRLARENVAEKTYWFSTDTPVAAKKSSAAYLLPGFDEFMLGYRDRSPSLAPKHADKICPSSNGVFHPTVVVDGQVIGTWKRIAQKSALSITPTPFESFGPTVRRALAAPARRYGQFVGSKATVVD
ncbi:conserved hypothetical protein [Chthoniobacter flavus Ellin428]|uniref:Winged helix DNA-binding domain-containing protein n=2 Tax=Chthoniobacter flavus TaxID=191863 RepID=B4D793_9BACT|nr:conserved hypothetical protein [Chthoniobacter flavus Ellin428]TCO87069.1 winged helix DNA-binding protein [Chthoniobacter flavus]